MDEAVREIDEAEGYDVEVPQELWDMLDGTYEPIAADPATINAVDDPICTAAIPRHSTTSGGTRS